MQPYKWIFIIVGMLAGVFTPWQIQVVVMATLLIGYTACYHLKWLNLQIVQEYLFGGISTGLGLQFLVAYGSKNRVIEMIIVPLLLWLVLRIIFYGFETKYTLERQVTDATNDPGQFEPPELVPAISALQSEQFDQVLELAEPLARHADSRIRADAARLMAFAFSRLNRYSEALPCWQNLIVIEPSPHNYAQLAASAAVLGRLEVAEPAFERAEQLTQESEQEGSSSLPMMWANYITALDLGGNPARALPYIDLLKRAYAGYHITDSTFLYIRGMPFFSVFIENALPVLQKVKTQEEIEAWLDELNDEVDDEGKECIAKIRS